MATSKKAAKKVATKKIVLSKRKLPSPPAKAKLSVKELSFRALQVEQGDTRLYVFKAKASLLYSLLTVNRRETDKDEGYQRAFSQSRVNAIRRYIKDANPIPGAIIVALDKGQYEGGKLTIPASNDGGWVIDGQHRLIGAHLASTDGTDVELAVVAFMGIDERHQIEQFVTINREAKNVPTSLYLDLLGKLPWKKPADFAKERATDIATELRRDEDSPLYERISVVTSPSAQQISLVNFVRKIAPYVTPDKGILGAYTQREQRRIVDNYFRAIRTVFPKEFDAKDSIFFKTIGFGAIWNVFGTLFSLTLSKRQGFQTTDVAAMLKEIRGFDFDSWRQLGSGNAAEIQAGEDLKAALLLAHQEGKSTSALKL